MPASAGGGPFGGSIRVRRHGPTRAISSHRCRMRRLRWLSVLAPVVAVAIIELVSDGLLDASLPFPLDTVVVVRRGGRPRVGLLRGRLSADRQARRGTPDPQCRSRATRGVCTSTPPGERRDRCPGRPGRDPPGDRRRGPRRLVGERRDPRRARPRWRGLRRGRERAGWRDRPCTAGTSRATEPLRFVRPDLAIARLEAPLQRAGETIGLLMVGSMVERGLRDRRGRDALVARQPGRDRDRERPPRRPDCASSRSWRNGNGSPARCTTASPRCSATSTPSRRRSRSSCRRPDGRGARPAGGTGGGGAVDLRRCPGGDPRAAQPRRAGCRAGRARSRTTPTGSPRPSKIVVRVEASADARRPGSRAGGRGPGLPDRPGGADQRPQALGRTTGRHRLRGRGRPARRRHRGDGRGLRG